ncbi:hypothetical protein [Frankia sp. Cj3]|uniref:hypothetical protein n=1 Tax=Frankia sp. Cj3 TaxID=2880976 RepID=UPI001EF69888|nr:hypothetical protein [Frankia sp. Cj3]
MNVSTVRWGPESSIRSVFTRVSGQGRCLVGAVPGGRSARPRSKPGLLLPSLLFIAVHRCSSLFIVLVVVVVGSLGTPLITSVATTFQVPLASARQPLTSTVLSGAAAPRPSFFGVGGFSA